MGNWSVFTRAKLEGFKLEPGWGQLCVDAGGTPMIEYGSFCYMPNEDPKKHEKISSKGSHRT